MSLRTAALVLSAGESSRFGGVPKALLSTGDSTAIRRLAETCLTEGFEPVAVVVGPHGGAIAHELRGLDVLMVDAKEWYEGRTASVQAGLAALPSEQDVLFWPVDHPFVSPRTVETLAAVRDRDLLGVWFIPTYRGLGGHPVLWRSSVAVDVMELRPDAPLRSLLPEFGPQVRRVTVDDPGVVANVDTPEAYAAALDEWQRRREV